MKAQLVLLIGSVVVGFGLGWLIAPSPEGHAVTLETAPIAHSGAEARAAHERLDRLGFAPPPIVDTGPPPPDIAILFRRDLTAIEDQAGGRVAWIVDFTQANQRRALRVGDVYQDGWRVSRVGVQSIDLRRRREMRTIDAFALPVIDP